MTGLLAHNHGVLQVEHCVDYDQSVLRKEKPHWAQSLVRAGYRTGYFGKWHIERSNKLEDFGWQIHTSSQIPKYLKAYSKLRKIELESLDHSIKRYQTGPEGYQPILHYAVTGIPIENRSLSLPTTLAREFLSESLEQTKSWCCCVSQPEPNHAMICSRETFNRYDVETMKLPPNLNDDLTSRPGIYKRTQRMWKDITYHQWQEARVCYYASITELDQQFGKLINQIEKADQLENTIIIVTSDHGRYVGAHGMEAHNFGAFEEIYNIPMLVSIPSLSENICSNARVGLHDLYTTILELTDLEPEKTPDSKSFVNVLRDPTQNEKYFTTGYAEYHGTRFPLAQRIFWDDQWKLIFNGFDFDELYNLNKDPYEMNNLAVDPAYQERLQMMMKEIWKKIDETNDRTLKETQYYSMRFASIGPDSIEI
jgi:arylsulfatase A-like enzyme